MTLDAILAELAPGLLRFTLGLLGERAVAEEVAQDALAALVVRWQRHGPPENAAAFVFAIARRRAGRERLKRRLLVPLVLVANRFAPVPGPEALAVGRSQVAATLAALDRLPRPEREAILLVAAGERSGSEAATLLGISPSALKMRLHRARRRLSEALGEAVPVKRSP